MLLLKLMDNNYVALKAIAPNRILPKLIGNNYVALKAIALRTESY